MLTNERVYVLYVSTINWVSDSRHSEYERTRLYVPCSSWMGRCLQLQFLSYYYSDLEPIADCCRYVPFHRGLQVSIVGHPGDSDVNLETFILFLSYTLARFICLWNLDLSFASCTSCTSAMPDITQLWGMCIIGKEEEETTLCS